MYVANVYRVMIASPGDVQKEREIARNLINEWNTHHSSYRKIVLLPLLWEDNSIPASGDSAQEIINDQLLQHADLVVGIFWSRVGSDTGKAISGTVEELETHVSKGKPAMLYFSSADLPQKHVRNQFEALEAYKKEAFKSNLCWSYNTPFDFEDQFRAHLTQKLNDPAFLMSDGVVENVQATVYTAAKQVLLTEEAKELLLAAAHSKDGRIMESESKQGLSITVNNKQFVTDTSARYTAKWRGAVEYLKSGGYIRQLIRKTAYTPSAVYEITDLGFQKADTYLAGR